MPVTVAETLELAQKLVKNGWTRGAPARTYKGKPVDVDDPKACRFCMIGAISRSAHDLKDFRGYSERFTDAVVEVNRQMITEGNRRSIIGFNDLDAKKKDVIALFQRTIDRLKLTPA